MTESFTTINRYFDNKYYPRGFSRHGGFTIREAQLPGRHGYTFNKLDLGKREPVTRGEKLLAVICRGEREPATEAERMRSKYMTRIKRPKRFHTLSDEKPQVEGAEDYAGSDD